MTLRYLINNYNNNLFVNYYSKFKDYNFHNNSSAVILIENNKKLVFNRPNYIKKALILFLEKEYKKINTDDEVIFDLFQKVVIKFKKYKEKYTHLEKEEVANYEKNLSEWENNGFYSEDIN